MHTMLFLKYYSLILLFWGVFFTMTPKFYISLTVCVKGEQLNFGMSNSGGILKYASEWKRLKHKK